MPEYIEGICKFLADKGVSLIERTDVIDIKTINEEEHEIAYLNPSKKEKSIISKNVVSITKYRNRR